MKKEKSAYITVYMSLVLGLLISLITTMLVGIRIHTIRFATECVMDMGLSSIFAEYNREMLEQYGMLFIDSSYGSGSPDANNTKAHLLHYMNMNFEEDDSGGKDLIACRADNASLECISYATDNSGEVLRYQIARYEESKYGINYITDISVGEVDMESMLGEYDNFQASREQANGTIDGIMDEINSNLEEDEEPYSISNPADSVESLGGSNALMYAIEDIGELRLMSVNSGDYVSHRGYRNGAGLRPTQNALPDVAMRPIMTDYIFEHCGYYKNEKNNSNLTYEVEYIISGHDSDLANMEDVANKIFKIRYVINMQHLFGNAAKQAEAEELALAVTSVLAIPELTEAVKMSILFAWGYAESAKDMRILYDGHKLSMIKTDYDWNTPLAELVSFKSCLNNYKIPSGNVDYKKFIEGFVMLQNINVTTMRLMDIMEMDIRLTDGNNRFMADGLIYQMTSEVNVSSDYGYGCSIKRFYTYE